MYKIKHAHVFAEKMRTFMLPTVVIFWGQNGSLFPHYMSENFTAVVMMFWTKWSCIIKETRQCESCLNFFPHDVMTTKI